MHSRFSQTAIRTAVLSLSLLLAGITARAQDIFVTPVPSAPFSATIEVQRSIVQRNGALANFTTIREIGRDSQGRIHNEARILVPPGYMGTLRVVRIHLYDPQTRTNAFLDPRQQTYRTNITNHPPSTEPPDMLATPSASAAPQSQFVTHDDLGTREMQGFEVHGVRETQTIPPNGSGADREVVVTDEYWYSADLHMNLLVKHGDPRSGNATLAVTHIKRDEPDPSFFEIPSSYKRAGAAVPAAPSGQ